jgi:hypothetical protein
MMRGEALPNVPVAVSVTKRTERDALLRSRARNPRPGRPELGNR